MRKSLFLWALFALVQPLQACGDASAQVVRPQATPRSLVASARPVASPGRIPGGVADGDIPGSIPQDPTFFVEADNGVYNGTDGTGLAADGENVGSWRDASDTNLLMAETSAGGGPTYLDNQLNGYPAIDFTSSNQRLQSTVGPTDILGTGADCTILVLAGGPSAGGAAGSGRIVAQDEGSGSNSKWIYHNGSITNSLAVHVQRTTAEATNWGFSTSDVIGTAFELRVLRRDAAGLYVGRTNGAQVYTTTIAGDYESPNTAAVTLGFAEGAGDWTGRLVAVVLYDRALSDNEVTDLETYFLDKYGL